MQSLKMETCEYFSHCGGCKDQGTQYERQLERKRKALASFLDLDIKVISGKPWGYRNRMDMSFNQDGIGFRMSGTWHSFIDIKECPIANEDLNALLAELRASFSRADHFDPATKEGTYRYAVIRTPSLSSSISFVLNSDSSGLEAAKARIRDYALRSSADNVLITYVPKKTDVSVSRVYDIVKGSDTLVEQIGGARFRFHAQSFFQNNTDMARAMHSYVSGILAASSAKTLVDLYGGVGTFGIVNAASYERVIMVETDQGSVDSARANILENGRTNCEVKQLDVKVLASIGGLEGADFVVDPPRGGIHPKAIRAMLGMEPDRIVYVSCNPRQLAQDIPRFLHYGVRSAAMVDMFPQTPHSESVIELVRDL